MYTIQDIHYPAMYTMHGKSDSKSNVTFLLSVGKNSWGDKFLLDDINLELFQSKLYLHLSTKKV